MNLMHRETQLVVEKRQLNNIGGHARNSAASLRSSPARLDCREMKPATPANSPPSLWGFPEWVTCGVGLVLRPFDSSQKRSIKYRRTKHFAKRTTRYHSVEQTYEQSVVKEDDFIHGNENPKNEGRGSWDIDGDFGRGSKKLELHSQNDCLSKDMQDNHSFENKPTKKEQQQHKVSTERLCNPETELWKNESNNTIKQQRQEDVKEELRNLETKLRDSESNNKQKHDDLEATIHRLETEVERTKLEMSIMQRKHDDSTSTTRKQRDREAQALHDHIRYLDGRIENDTRKFDNDMNEMKSQRDLIQAEFNTFARKQQEAAFKNMESARWLPTDEFTVMSQLDRLKCEMRSWAKANATNADSLIQSLNEEDKASLIQALGNIALVEDGQLVDGLENTARSSILLLNALLAHHVCESFFESPFFFLGEDPEKKVLEEIYLFAKQGTLGRLP